MGVAEDVEPRRERGGGSAIAEYFRFAERGTDLVKEARAGLTTFMVMAYIIAVNPAILAAAGVPVPAAAAGTALVAGVMTILMGVVANVPIALAAGLGLNGVVAFQLAGAGNGPLTWQGAMGVIVLEGIVITVLVIVGLREAVFNAVPLSLKKSISVGIGLFILFIGFVDGGLIRIPASQAVPVEFVFPNSPGPWVTLFGLVLSIVLVARRVPAALLISIIITTIVAIVTGLKPIQGPLAVTPDFGTIGQFDIGQVGKLGALTAVLTVFTIMLADFFDTMGTATAIGTQSGIADKQGRIPGISRILLVDSIAAFAGGAAGVSSNTSYIESAAGVAEGGRTGFTSVVTGVLFLFAILLSPLAALVPFQATAPVLIVVGFLMVSQLADIDFGDIEEGLPALFGIILMPLTYSITVGIGAAFVTYVGLKVIRGKLTEVHPLLWAVAIAFVIYFAQAYINGVVNPAPPA